MNQIQNIQGAHLQCVYKSLLDYNHCKKEKNMVYKRFSSGNYYNILGKKKHNPDCKRFYIFHVESCIGKFRDDIEKYNNQNK